MATTDRMSNLDSSRAGVDRTGGTVTFGNSIESEGVEIIAAASAGFGSESDAESSMVMAASITGDLTNGSFGIWAVDFASTGVGLLTGDGASMADSPMSAIATALATWGADGMLLNIQVFTSTGAYTPTSGTAQVVVVALGGGGGGGGCSATAAGQASPAGGGGAGALAIGRITSGFSGVTVTVGAGGSGGAAGNNAGSSGGSSQFGSVLIAGGGSGGGGALAAAVNAIASGSGGSASGSASLFGASGQSGCIGLSTSDFSVGGNGGHSMYGNGRSQNIAIAGSGVGADALGFGAGGAGASSQGAAGSARAGGNGAPGLVIIYEYNA